MGWGFDPKFGSRGVFWAGGIGEKKGGVLMESLSWLEGDKKKTPCVYLKIHIKYEIDVKMYLKSEGF